MPQQLLQYSYYFFRAISSLPFQALSKIFFLLGFTGAFGRSAYHKNSFILQGFPLHLASFACSLSIHFNKIRKKKSYR
jgi:hypothetical protein